MGYFFLSFGAFLSTDHVPDWKPRILLSMVEARSVNVNNTHTHTGAQGTLSLSKNCTSRESVSPLSRLIRGFRNKYH